MRDLSHGPLRPKAEAEQPSGQVQSLRSELAPAEPPKWGVPPPPPPQGQSAQEASRPTRIVEDLLENLSGARERATEALAHEREVAQEGAMRLLRHAQGLDMTIRGVSMARGSEAGTLRPLVSFIRVDGVGQIAEEPPPLAALAGPLEELAISILSQSDELRLELRLDPVLSVSDLPEGRWEDLLVQHMSHARIAGEHRELLEASQPGSLAWSHHESQEAHHLDRAEKCRRAMNVALDREQMRHDQDQRGVWEARVDPMFENDPFFGTPDSVTTRAIGRVAEIRPRQGVQVMSPDQVLALLEHLPQLKDKLDDLLVEHPEHPHEVWQKAETLLEYLSERDTTEEPWRMVIQPLYEYVQSTDMVGWRVGIWLPEKKWGDAGGDSRLIHRAPELLGTVKGLCDWAKDEGLSDSTIWVETRELLEKADPGSE